VEANIWEGLVVVQLVLHPGKQWSYRLKTMDIQSESTDKKKTSEHNACCRRHGAVKLREN